MADSNTTPATSTTTPTPEPKKVVKQRKRTTDIPVSIQKLPTKAAKIRALWVSGKYSRYAIAKRLGVSFQHVYNTTQRPTKGYDPDKYTGPKK